MADWKTHKRECAAPKPTPSGQTDFNAMPKPMGDFFKNLVGDTYLHSFPKPYTYQQLIDCYRMRLEDDSNFANEKRGLYAGKDPTEDFGRFLNLVESRRGLLPGWWSPETREACETMAMDGTQWAHIGRTVTKMSVIEHYEDSKTPMSLRLLAEKIYGKKISMGV